LDLGVRLLVLFNFLTAPETLNGYLVRSREMKLLLQEQTLWNKIRFRHPFFAFRIILSFKIVLPTSFVF
jgi:hypothetical protein